MPGDAEPRTSDHDDPAADGVALLIIDMINCFDFPGSEKLKPGAERAADRIAGLLTQARDAGHPVIYVNDNFGEWHSEKSKLIEMAEAKADSRALALLRPDDTDYFIIKPQFSGFYATNLPVLLPKLGASKLVLTGVATDICILFTAADAHMRDYALWIPEDCVASDAEARGQWALETMRNSMSAETSSSAKLTLAQWRKNADAQREK
ncbi:cysteine hydrolase [Sphingobium sufflavum]|uniref:cysteine hydrolase family protein n=1 Tax=Sphingobium sufflavum TaxID=1129547 RepID=UPI001F1C557C|nr:isochorismatase family cysteine hydrolase [Sphingobium sufflavum]MCE7798174.1 cysteine hydrolase [Sphingobium sufflavum]